MKRKRESMSPSEDSSMDHQTAHLSTALPSFTLRKVQTIECGNGQLSLQAFSHVPSRDDEKALSEPQANIALMQGTGPAYQPYTFTEVHANGVNQPCQLKSITCMPTYRNMSLEELRLQDYD